MYIYIISKHDMESSWVHSAYESEEIVKLKVQELNDEEARKNEIYNTWVMSDGPEEECPDFGDYTFTYNKVWLEK